MPDNIPPFIKLDGMILNTSLIAHVGPHTDPKKPGQWKIEFCGALTVDCSQDEAMHLYNILVGEKSLIDTEND